ncbi:heptaprenyl diphosphate synthase component 1 [Saccharibacillus alkalitolerans]|uniref:Heptaprenyl diphosphate synthase component 1 n=1 Tax=Saccharibacillus alkalitolerans TaxID=2705290 RepID=A0ABX0F3L4_9BACL|nr:heptaprenyl diphosphate synthase component 1 [Saccharibacillus alkalitolerans]NGZ74238.1 heptaprenyl diphosphate synthase component 1 [Saccharibacillus alkalitolerans]
MKPYCVPEKTGKYTGYDMIRKHTDIPALPDARLRLLHAFLEASESAVRSEVYGTVTALLQTGLDIHDRVAPGDDSEEEQAMRSRQLKVLAGDYYSSRFYELLAASGEIGMVAELSRAIADVNRSKMELYLRMQGDAALELREYLECVAAIKIRLFESFDVLLDGPLLPHWQELLLLAGLCEAAAEELAADSNGEEPIFRPRADRIEGDGFFSAAELSELLRGFAERLESGIESLPEGVNRDLLRPLAAGFKSAADTKGRVMG